MILDTEPSELDQFDTKVDNYFYKVNEALSFYNKLGVVSHVDANGHIDDVYTKVVAAIFPTLIFIYCPPGCWATTVASKLSSSIGYSFLSLKSLATKKISDEQHLNILIDYLEKSNSFKFVIDSFFPTKRIFSVFLKEFCAPHKVVYLNYTKDQAAERILQLYQKGDLYEEKKAQFKTWLSNRDEILAFLKTQPYLDCHCAFGCNSATLCKIIQDKYAPTTFLLNSRDSEISEKIVQKLEKEKGHIHIDINSLLQDHVTRNTQEGKEFSTNPSPELVCQVLRKLLFKNLDHKNFLISKLSENLDNCILFEEDVCKVKYFLDIIPPEFVYPSNPEGNPNDISIFIDSAAYYWSQGKLLKVNSDSIEFLELYLEKRNVYGIVVGFPSSGKTTISKHICSKYSGQWIDYEELTNKLKEQLGTPDEPLDELPFPDQFPHIANMLSTNDPSNPFIFDGFPFEMTDLKNFIEKVGTPSFVIDLNVSGENAIAAFKRKNEMEPDAEIGEDEQERLDAAIKSADEFSGFFKEISGERPGINYFSVNANFSMSFLLHQTDKIFQKRVFAFEANISDSHQAYGSLYNKLANHCLANGIAFVDVSSHVLNFVGAKNEMAEKMLADYKMTGSTVAMLDYPGNYSPSKVLNVVKQNLNSSVTHCRDILLFGYPCAYGLQKRSEEEKLNSRALDMLSFTEDTLGPIKAYHLFTSSPIEVTEDVPMIEWPAKEEPEPKVPAEGEGEGEEGEEKEEEPPAEEEEEGEEGAVKFDPTQFSWSDTNGLPRDFVKVYFEHKRPTNEVLEISSEDLEKVNQNLTEFISALGEGSQENQLKQWII